MQQGYVPPGQGDQIKHEGKAGGKMLRFVYIVISVVALMGFIAERNLVVRILLLSFAIVTLILFRKSKKNSIRLPAIPSQSAHKIPEVKTHIAQLPIPPKTIGGVPLAYHYQEVDIAMTIEVVKDFSIFHPGDVISFIPESTNVYDSKAIQLWSNNQLLGYVYRGKIQDMLNDFLKFGEPIYGMIFSVKPEEKKITFSVGFYRPAKPKSSGKMLASGRLTTNSGQEAQDNISICDEGDEVSIDYDYDKERYEVSCIDFIGCLPKKLEQYADTATFLIDEIGENENGKYYVVVGAYVAKS